MKKSIGDNMIPKEFGFERGLELVKRAGFDRIELWLGDPGDAEARRWLLASLPLLY
jgi:hypothetical protein